MNGVGSGMYFIMYTEDTVDGQNGNRPPIVTCDKEGRRGGKGEVTVDGRGPTRNNEPGPNSGMERIICLEM